MNGDNEPTREEMDGMLADGEAFHCDVCGTVPGNHCAACSQGYCEDCGETIPRGKAGSSDAGLVWCFGCTETYGIPVAS